MSVNRVYNLDRIEVPPAPAEYEDHTSDRNYVPAPCQVASPIGTDAPSYIAYIWEGKFAEAFEAITATNPFSSICGRVCDAPCEPACRRTQSDGPVQIRNLKRFVMDKLGATWRPQPVAVTKSKTIGIVGSGPCGLVAAHDLCVAGYEVHVYEMTDRLGGTMIWGIPAFRLPPHVIQEDIDRLIAKCPGLKVHLNTALGRDVTLDELKARHAAVLLAIGSWWGKPMSIPGEDDPRVVDGVSFLRRVNGAERPTLPETVVVVGGGDVAMDACRVAKRLPGCKQVKVIYRRAPEEMPARKIELEGAIKEGIEFIYNTLQVAVEPRGEQLALRCVKTAMGEPGTDGRRQPVQVAGSEHQILCGMVIAAVGQKGESDELDQRGLMLTDRVKTEWNNMRTSDPKVFAAGDGAFGGSTIVMAMHHGQRTAYYLKHYLEGRDNPLPYRTPYRTRRVPVAQDLTWELNPVQHPQFFGLGKDPIKFPEIESTYEWEMARREAARCYRCDAETGSADYAVQHREDLFSMARTNPSDHPKLRAMLQKRLHPRDNPFPEGRSGQLDDIVFLPANLSRLVIDPYREACKISTDIAGQLDLEQPFMVAGFDEAPDEVRDGVAAGLIQGHSVYLGRRPIHADVPWFQIITDKDEPSAQAVGLIYVMGTSFRPVNPMRISEKQVLGLAVSSVGALEQALPYALDHNFQVLLCDATGALGTRWPELACGAPNLKVLCDTIKILRHLKKEETIDIIYFGGARSGTDAAKLIALGCKVIVYGVAVGLAVGGSVVEHDLQFTSDYGVEEHARGAVNILKASAAEASMMARATGKTKLHNMEPEDLRSVTLATCAMTGLPLAGTH